MLRYLTNRILGIGTRILQQESNVFKNYYSFSSITIHRNYANETNPKPRVPIQLQFPQICRELKSESVVLIDVREPGELLKDGRISENSRNIPLGELEIAFGLDDEEFLRKYGFNKPNFDTKIITHCKLGIRATKGGLALSKAGYKNVAVYPGIVDWVESGGELIK